MGYILAYTLNYNNHDGRYSHSNKEWADTTCKGERGSNIRTDWIVRSHPTVLNGFVDMYRKELAAEQQREPEKPFVQQFYVVTDLQTNPMKIEKFGNLDDAMSCYQQVPNFHLKALGVEKTPDPLPGSLDIVQCKNGIPNKLLTSLKCCFHWIHAISNDLFVYIFQLFLPSLLQPVFSFSDFMLSRREKIDLIQIFTLA